MSKIEMSAGKFRNLRVLSGVDGRFLMMAIDQRGSLKRMLAKSLSVSADAVKFEDLAAVKKSIVKILSPHSTATLTDPVYGYPHCIHYIPRDVGLLLAYEETGYKKEGQERRSSLIEGWSAEKIKRAGANAVKLLVYYRPDASERTLEHQHALIRQVGDECEQYDLPFVLELVSYPLLEDELPADRNAPVTTDSAAFARRKPEIVMKTAQQFSLPEYKADVLKIEFPADLKYTKEYCDGTFDGKKRPALYDLDDVRQFCRKVDEASGLPWVILSAGVQIEEFIEDVRLATEAGASGFLGGRAIWQGCVKFYPDTDAVEQWLSTSGANNFRRLYEASRGATPWFEHKRFGGYPNIELADDGKNWYRNFSGFTS